MLMYDDWYECGMTENNTRVCLECGSFVQARYEECPECGGALGSVDSCPICGCLKDADKTACEDCETLIYRQFCHFANEMGWDDRREFLEIIEGVVYDKE